MTRKWLHIVCIITALVFFAGCESKSPPPPEKKMVRKKISAGKAPKKTPAPKKKKVQTAKKPGPPARKPTPKPSTQVAKKAAPTKVQPAKKKPAPTKATTSKPSSKTAKKAIPVPPKPSSKTAKKPIPAPPKKKTPAAAPASPKPVPPAAPKTPEAVADKTKPAGTTTLPNIVATAQGLKRGGAQAIRVDPFQPAVKAKPKVKKGKRGPRRPKRTRPKTPLERLDLSQLKLTAIISTPSGRRALVEESSGKGYVTKKGTYIGVHEGQVVQIEPDRVIVEEEIENAIGELMVNKRELRLPRRFGE